MPEELNIEVNIAKEDRATETGVLKLGEPPNYACPECHGVLLELKERHPLPFRCHTGHAYTLESLLSEMDDVIEDSLWNAIRALEERAMLMRHASEHLPSSNGDMAARADETQNRANTVRTVVVREVKAKTGAAR